MSHTDVTACNASSPHCTYFLQWVNALTHLNTHTHTHTHISHQTDSVSVGVFVLFAGLCSAVNLQYFWIIINNHWSETVNSQIRNSWITQTL